MNILVTGGAGFIGPYLVKTLLSSEHNVTVFDNFSSGKLENLNGIEAERLQVIKGDCTEPSDVSNIVRGQDIVFHLAANPEVRAELNNSENCFRQNVYATFLLMEAIATSTITKVVFASTSTIYGEAKVIPTPETYGELKPVSYYGASKLASEALISSYCSMNKKKAIILRLANVIGGASNHGVTIDLIKKLRQSPSSLEVLGDGSQTKSYLHIEDCISAIMCAWKNAGDSIEIFNVGSSDRITVSDIAKIVVAESNSNAKISYTGGIDGGRGWMGDVKLMQLDSTKLESVGWRPQFSSRVAITKTVREYLQII